MNESQFFYYVWGVIMFILVLYLIGEFLENRRLKKQSGGAG